MNNAKKVAFFGVFAALAVTAGYLERLIPAPTAIPGIKLGFANIIVLITLYELGTKEAFGVSIIRILITGLLFGGITGMVYSLSGGLLSLIMMLAGKKARLFSVIGVSVLGGVFHNIGQITLAAIVMETTGVMYYLPALVFSGIITGILTGTAAGFTINHLSYLKIYNE